MKSYNRDLYITAATVIPVLYLALALQGNTIRDAIMRGKVGDPKTTTEALRQAALLAVSALATAVVIWSLVAEYSALQALYTGRVGSHTNSVIYNYTLLLFLAVFVGPVVWVYQAIFAPLVEAGIELIKHRRQRADTGESAASPEPEAEG